MLKINKSYKKILTENKELKIYIKRLEKKIYTDSLTELFNRRKFDFDMKKKIKKNSIFTLAFIDLDNMSKFNNTYGHKQADNLLKEISKFFKKISGRNATVYRYGGDEFVILFNSSETKKSEQIINKIQNNFDNIFPIGTSIGYAHKENNNYTAEEIFDLADARMYKNKKARKQKSLLEKLKNNFKRDNKNYSFSDNVN